MIKAERALEDTGVWWSGEPKEVRSGNIQRVRDAEDTTGSGRYVWTKIYPVCEGHGGPGKALTACLWQMFPAVIGYLHF